MSARIGHLLGDLLGHLLAGLGFVVGLGDDDVVEVAQDLLVLDELLALRAVLGQEFRRGREHWAGQAGFSELNDHRRGLLVRRTISSRTERNYDRDQVELSRPRSRDSGRRSVAASGGTMTNEREQTLKILADVRRKLRPTIRQLNRIQRRRARFDETWVDIEHALTGPPEELMIWGEHVLYQFDKRYLDETYVDTAPTTLGYSFYVKHVWTEDNRLKRLVVGPRHIDAFYDSSSCIKATPVRLLVRKDGSPMFFWGNRQYSADIEGWNQFTEQWLTGTEPYG